MSQTNIRQSILELTKLRGPEKTICPSEVARKLDADNWRAMMNDVRSEAIRLEQEARIAVLQPELFTTTGVWFVL
jgi:hypothetical protein